MGQRLRGRLLLARTRPGRRDRWPPLPPHPISPEARRQARPRPHPRRHDAVALHATRSGTKAAASARTQPSLSVAPEAHPILTHFRCGQYRMRSCSREAPPLYSPNTVRIAPRTSPIEASAARAARIGCRRLPSPRATSSSASSLASTPAWSQFSLKALRRASWRCSDSGSTEDVDVVDRLVGDELVDADDHVLAGPVALVVARAPTPRSPAG